MSVNRRRRCRWFAASITDDTAPPRRDSCSRWGLYCTFSPPFSSQIWKQWRRQYRFAANFSRIQSLITWPLFSKPCISSTMQRVVNQDHWGCDSSCSSLFSKHWPQSIGLSPKFSRPHWPHWPQSFVSLSLSFSFSFLYNHRLLRLITGLVSEWIPPARWWLQSKSTLCGIRYDKEIKEVRHEFVVRIDRNFTAHKSSNGVFFQTRLIIRWNCVKKEPHHPMKRTSSQNFQASSAALFQIRTDETQPPSPPPFRRNQFKQPASCNAETVDDGSSLSGPDPLSWQNFQHRSSTLKKSIQQPAITGVCLFWINPGSVS